MIDVLLFHHSVRDSHFGPFLIIQIFLLSRGVVRPILGWGFSPPLK